MTDPRADHDPLAARVARGMAVLDERMPGWDQRIDVQALDMGMPMYRPGRDCGCILAQLDFRPERAGSYFRLLRDLADYAEDQDAGSVADEEDAWAFDHGFLAFDEKAKRPLTRAWRRAIVARREGALA